MPRLKCSRAFSTLALAAAAAFAPAGVSALALSAVLLSLLALSAALSALGLFSALSVAMFGVLAAGLSEALVGLAFCPAPPLGAAGCACASAALESTSHAHKRVGAELRRRKYII